MPILQFSPILYFSKTTEMGDGGRVSGNLQTLGAYGGRNRARMDRATCRAFDKKSYSEPRWSKSRGAVIADEKVTLYGVPIVASRPVNYGAIDPTISREIFIQSALVEGDWNTKHKFFKENQRLLREVEELEHKSRRRDILVDDRTLLNFTISVLARK